MTTSDLPYPNGLAARTTELERRVGKIEDRQLPTEVAILKEQIRDIRDDIRGLKRATYAACVLLISVLGVLVPVLTAK